MKTLLILMATLTLQPISDAVAKLSSRTPVGSTLRSADWERVPVEIRERAQFSARVENARVMDRIQKGLTDILTHTKDANGVVEDRSRFIAELAKLAEAEGLRPTDPALIGTIQDITSERRAELILKTQTEQAYNYARHKRGSSGPLLRAAPAQELVRIRNSREKRRWVDVWRANGGKTFAGSPSIGGALQDGAGGVRCIALKGDPIWARISRFGTPWPPFDFGSGVGVTNITRTEAIRLGLVAKGETPKVDDPGLNENLEIDLADMSPGIREQLLRGLGDKVSVSDDTLKWKGAA